MAAKKKATGTSEEPVEQQVGQPVKTFPEFRVYLAQLREAGLTPSGKTARRLHEKEIPVEKAVQMLQS